MTGRITAQDTNDVSTEAQELIDGLELPGDVTATAGGESEDIQESLYNLFLSIIVALVLVYLLLLAVPLTTAGAFGTLLLTNTALNLSSLLGILLLIDIVSPTPPCSWISRMGLARDTKTPKVRSSRPDGPVCASSS